MTDPARHLHVRFWAKVAQDRADGCWTWQACLNHAGYGLINVERVSRLAHRIAWQLEHGAIPEGMCVLHRCDNPPCVNPAHLFLGTHDDNMRDMSRKRRARGWGPGGEQHAQARLTEAQVGLARSLYSTGMSQTRIAASLGVARTTIGRIVRGETWQQAA